MSRILADEQGSEQVCDGIGDQPIAAEVRVGAAINNVTGRVAVTNKDNSAEMARIKDVYRVVAEREAQTRASFADSEHLLNDSLHLLNQTVLNNNVSAAFDT